MAYTRSVGCDRLTLLTFHVVLFAASLALFAMLLTNVLLAAIPVTWFDWYVVAVVALGVSMLCQLWGAARICASIDCFRGRRRPTHTVVVAAAATAPYAETIADAYTVTADPNHPLLHEYYHAVPVPLPTIHVPAGASAPPPPPASSPTSDGGDSTHTSVQPTPMGAAKVRALVQRQWDC